MCVGPRSAVFAPVATSGCSSSTRSTTPPTSRRASPATTPARRSRQRAARTARAGPRQRHPAPGELARLPRIELPDEGGRPTASRRWSWSTCADHAGRYRSTHEPCEALTEVAARGGKAIVLLNRRGCSPSVSCRAAGRWELPGCDVSLVVHGRAAGAPRDGCHHCGHAEPAPRCPECGSVASPHGAGTERMESCRRGADGLPGVPARLRRGAGAARHLEILRRFDAAEPGCWSAPRWWPRATTSRTSTLGVVLDADATLRFPDFRAEERTFALVAQLAGRSGRGDRGAGARADARP